MATKKEEKIVAEAPVTKTRKPREKKRPIEELLTLPEKKLSDAEKNMLITHLKEELRLAKNKAEAYDNSAQSAFEQNRQIEAQFKDMEAYFNDKLKYINNQVNSFHAAINMAIKGGAQ